VAPHDDPRWPTHCDSCSEVLLDNAKYQIFAHTLYRGCPDGKLYTFREAPIGAMWDAKWMGEHFRGHDGIALVVKTPGGDWLVDGACSNCTRPGEDHDCWVRHGDPRTGEVHVDKNGDTCAAGAGSILLGNYHGFLHHGYLTDC
jgi:hypothetical protein